MAAVFKWTLNQCNWYYGLLVIHGAKKRTTWVMADIGQSCPLDPWMGRRKKRLTLIFSSSCFFFLADQMASRIKRKQDWKCLKSYNTQNYYKFYRLAVFANFNMIWDSGFRESSSNLPISFFTQFIQQYAVRAFLHHHLFSLILVFGTLEYVCHEWLNEYTILSTWPLEANHS